MTSAPWLNGSSLPEEERDFTAKLSATLGLLQKFKSDFEAALSLYDFCIRNPMGSNSAWQYIAGRDGAMTIWHFYEAMERVRKSLDARKYPVLTSLIDFEPIRKAVADLKAAFPAFEQLRHSVAHSGDAIVAHEKHGAINPKIPEMTINGKMFISTGFINDHFTNTFDGKLQSYELSVSSLAAIDLAMTTFLSGFAPAAEKLMKDASALVTQPQGP